jgi:transcriptional regulatory protein LEU3
MICDSLSTVLTIGFRFFDNYAPFLPILDPGMSPNAYHSLSPFLFWIIFWVGSRKYSGYRTITKYLAPRIISLAMLSLVSRATPIQVIQGLLLLCTWPVPVNTESKDVTHILSGAAMNLAMEIGLHTFGIGQDFARTRLAQDEKEKVFRARLWLHCLIVYQR